MATETDEAAMEALTNLISMGEELPAEEQDVLAPGTLSRDARADYRNSRARPVGACPADGSCFSLSFEYGVGLAILTDCFFNTCY